MNVLTIHEIYMILDALKEKHGISSTGGGWKGEPDVRVLRAKLTLMLETAHEPQEIRRGGA
jgi:hypothetical protein